jgi:hypothetical protein
MATNPRNSSDSDLPADIRSVEVPAPMAWPLVLSLGVALLTAGLATNLVISLVGVVLFVIGLAGWIHQFLPGRGHIHEPMTRAGHGPIEQVGRPGTVEQLRPGMAGYRFRLPEKVHPISAGVKGGIVGGLLMPIPALAYGLMSGHGVYFPINLLAGMVVPGITGASVSDLEQFHPGVLVLGIIIHATFSVTFGLLFGVISPTLPPMPGGPLIAGAVIMPILWTALCYGFMGIVNPLLEKYVSWPWFIASQVVYGLAMSIVVLRTHKVPVEPAGGPPEPPEVHREHL